MTDRLRARSVGPVILAVIVVMAAVTVHTGVWYYVSRHLGLSSAVASALVALAIAKHLGWIGGAYALLRRRRTPHA